MSIADAAIAVLVLGKFNLTMSLKANTYPISLAFSPKKALKTSSVVSYGKPETKSYLGCHCSAG